MARPKRSEPGAKLFVRTDASRATRLEKLAVKATRETGIPVIAVEMHRRMFAPGLAALESCKECRAGTCDGAHARKGAPTIELPADAAVELPPIVTPAPPDPAPVEPSNPAPLILAPVESPAAAPRRGRPVGSKNATKRMYPEGFALTDEMRAYAVKNGIAADRVTDMFEHFSTHHRAKGSKFVDWTLAFYNWVRNDKQFGGRNQARNERPKSTQDEPLPEGWS